MTFQMTAILPVDQARLGVERAVLRYAGPPAMVIAGAVILSTVGSWVVIVAAFAGLFR